MKRYLHTMFRVSDLEQTLDFYTAKLGMKVLRRRDGVNEKGPYTMVFLALPGDEAAQIELVHRPDSGPLAAGANFGHIAYEVTDIYAACARFVADGITLLRPPRDGRLAFIAAPDHIVVELIQSGTPLEPCEPWLSMTDGGAW